MKIQALGDSMIKRLDYFSKRNQHSCPLEIERAVGISGGTIHDIKRVLKQQRIQFDPEIPLVIFLGTNDIFKNTKVQRMCSQYKSLVRFLRNQCPSLRLVLTQLPNYPRAQASSEQLEKISKFNQFLSTLFNEQTKVLSVQQWQFSATDFHQYYPNGGRKDGIHFNDKGNRKYAYRLQQLYEQQQ